MDMFPGILGNQLELRRSSIRRIPEMELTALPADLFKGLTSMDHL